MHFLFYPPALTGATAEEGGIAMVINTGTAIAILPGLVLNAMSLKMITATVRTALATTIGPGADQEDAQHDHPSYP